MSEFLNVSKEGFWEEKYLRGHMPWDIGQAAPAFVKYFGSLNLESQSYRFAVLGSGHGHDAFYIAKQNHTSNVYGFDFSKSATEYCNETRQKLGLSNITFLQADFFKLVEDKKWESYFNYVIEHTSLAAIDPARRKEYEKLIFYLLKPGGKLIGLFFTRPKERGGPPFGISPEEVRELFKGNLIEIEKLHLVECLHKGVLDGDEYFGVFEKKK